jgi:hypothetical protein
LTGERLNWFRVASHLKVPVGELKRRITFTEFLDWCEFLNLEELRHSKMDYYLAQIAAEVRRSFVENPRKVKISDFFIELVSPDKKAKVEKSKQSWAAALKLNLN